jgi:GTPase SAR1 family protein
MFAVDSRKSFEAMEKWKQRVLECHTQLINNPDFEPAFILVGNKCDLATKREVSSEEGHALAKAWSKVSQRNCRNPLMIGFPSLSRNLLPQPTT